MFLVSEPRRFIGRVVDNGHSARFVQVAAGMPLTAQWRRGDQVRGQSVLPGTVIATFNSHGLYTNRTDGSAHACIFLSQEATGIRVLSQWVGQPVHERLIRFRGGSGVQANDGDAFYVVVTRPDPTV